MPIVQTINSFSQFSAAFRHADRRDQFQNLRWLYEHLENLSGEPVELDVIALCCEYTEDTYDEILSSYPDCGQYTPDPSGYTQIEDFITGYDKVGDAIYDAREVFDEEAFAEARREAILDYLRDNTSVCGFDDETVLYAQF